MKPDFFKSQQVKVFTCFFISLFCSGSLWSQTTIPGEVTIGVDEKINYSGGLNLSTNNSHLIVYGTVVIEGNLEMSGNQSKLTLHPGSVVIVTGNVIASNQVVISASSYFIVYGSLSRTTGSTQGSADFENGDVYIFGEVDETWNIDKCVETENNSCDYQGEEDFLEENLPEIVQEAMNCFNIPPIVSNPVCEGQDAHFSFPEIANAASYQWQESTVEGIWTDRLNETSTSLTIPNVQLASNGTKYRVVVRGAPDSNCKIGISKPVTLTVSDSSFNLDAISGETNTCGKTGPFEYSIPAPSAVVTYQWTVPTGWSIQGSSTAPTVSIVPGDISGVITVHVSNTCGITQQRSISVSTGTPGKWNGSVNGLWEEPGNWGCGMVPDAATAVLIPSGITQYPTITQNISAELQHLSIEAGAALVVQGSLKVTGDISSSGTFAAQDGSLVFQGASIQAIPANILEGNTLRDIRIDNPSGVSLEGTLKVSGTVETLSGNLHSNGNLILASTAEKTALISGTGNGAVVGAVTLERYLDPAYGYKYFSSPFSNSTVAAFTPFIELVDAATQFPHFYKYQENRKDINGNDLSGWEAYLEPTNPLNIMEGYAVNFGSAGSTINIALTGEVNNGPLTVSLSNTNGEYTQGFHLVGNPYPSPIDWNKPGWTKTNLDDALYFYTASSTDPYSGTYSSYVNGGPSSDGKSSNIIPSMQGFFVHVSNGSSEATLGITNEVRLEDFSQAFVKSAHKEIFSLIRINAGFENSPVKDPAVLYFRSNANKSFDTKLDALKLANTDPEVPNLYSLTPDKKELSINALPLVFNESITRIPLGVQTSRSGHLRLQLQDLENIPAGYHLYLVDLEKKAHTELISGKGYSTPVSKGTFNNRFEIVLSKAPLTDSSRILNLPMSVLASKEKISVQLNLEMGQEAEIFVSSLSGQVLKTLRGTAQEKVELEGIKSAGMYIISLRAGDTHYSEKIIITK